MSYMALYRKWRPVSFEDVKGQDPVVQTLKNQITSDRIGHAYLFCGTRGTGKTSIAKIYARAVNCEHPIDGSPCNQCASCRAILEGSSMNVVEIDAASNNGVENIRDIREQVQYPPTEGKYRVYIIDEVHMLSIGAFNALLKTLEEPPAYVIFILATTEVHKIPITILSRCQRYDFKRISLETIADRLRELTQAEQIQAEDKALMYIAKAADGSLRDGLSLLDQCVAFHYGKLLTYENALEVLGAVDSSVFSRMFNVVADGRTRDCITELEEIVKMVGMDALSPTDRLKMEAARSIREDFLHQNSFHEVDTYTSLKKQHMMMRLVNAFYERSVAALGEGASLRKLISMPVREQIGRFKYVKEDALDAEFVKVDEELSAQIANAFVKEDR